MSTETPSSEVAILERLLHESSSSNPSRFSRDIVARIELQTRCVTDIELLELGHVLRVSVESLLPKRRIK